MGTGAEPKRVEANGVDFAYIEEGSGPLVLMLHGFPDGARTWDAVRPAVAAAGFRCVTPFMRGYFPTAIPSDSRYDSETLGNDVLALIAALGEERAIVVGQDWGANAAYCAAGLEPERVRLLVTLAIPHPATMLPTPSLLWTVRHFFTLNFSGAAARTRKGDFRHLDELGRALVAGVDGAARRDRCRARRALAARTPRGRDRLLQGPLAIMPKSMRRRVEVPAVSFAGETDIVSPDAYERARKHFKASYEVVKLPGGHFMHREHPEAFERELLRVMRTYG
jgi:pimeloyl-ACP methyl ester carboxylesterase